MVVLRVWSAIVGLFGLLALAQSLYVIVVGRSALAALYFVIWLMLWMPAAVKVTRRQDLRPRWFWVATGSLGGILVLVPLWHYGREFTSRWDRVISWLAVVAVLCLWVLLAMRPI